MTWNVDTVPIIGKLITMIFRAVILRREHREISHLVKRKSMTLIQNLMIMVIEFPPCTPLEVVCMNGHSMSWECEVRVFKKVRYL